MSNPKKRAAPSQDGEGQTKKKKKKSAYHVDETLLNSELDINEAFAVMDNQLLADYTAQKIARFGTDLSPVEVSDLSISANSIKDTTSWTEPRALEKLPEFLEKFAEKPESLGRAPEKKGAPHTIIVAGAGLRAADIVRAVRKFQTKKNTVLKLVSQPPRLPVVLPIDRRHVIRFLGGFLPFLVSWMRCALTDACSSQST
ncbi:hypothetical protein CGRA01v4_14782 [Colletotrichum graminicola]|nr:hypothetical protein CGRA01v4_14782 [Colletotrichum graminicola]